MGITGFVYHEDYLKHRTGRGHPERPERLKTIVGQLEKTGLLQALTPLAPAPAEEKWIEEIHSPAYIRRVEAACRRGQPYLDSSDTGISPDSFGAALLAAGGLLAASDAVMAGRVKSAFCAVRPPGHHAERDYAMGFCLFNNVAVCARYLQKKHGLRKVLIVDWDVHHGNGTQHAFYSDPTVFYFSTHQFPHYPGTGRLGETGEGEGEGTTINVPLPAGTGDAEYIRVFEEILTPKAKAFSPDFVLVSAGFDPHRDDPLSDMRVTEEGFARMTGTVRRIAAECCAGRLVSTLEGGYNLEALAASAESHLRALLA